MDEGSCDGDHARVRLLHIIVAGFTVLIEYMPCAFRLCVDVEFMRITPWAQTASDAAGLIYSVFPRWGPHLVSRR